MLRILSSGNPDAEFVHCDYCFGVIDRAVTG